MSRDAFRRWRKTIKRYHLNKIDTIRGNNRTAFTRHRKVSPENLLLQMLSQRGMAQRQEVKILFEDSGMSDIDISDVQPTAKTAPDNMPHMIKLSGLSDVYNHTIKRIAIDEYSHDERGHAIELLGSIKKEEESKTLVVFDRGYFSFKLLNLFDNSKMKHIFRISTYVVPQSLRTKPSSSHRYIP